MLRSFRDRSPILKNVQFWGDMQQPTHDQSKQESASSKISFPVNDLWLSSFSGGLSILFCLLLSINLSRNHDYIHLTSVISDNHVQIFALCTWLSVQEFSKITVKEYSSYHNNSLTIITMTDIKPSKNPPIQSNSYLLDNKSKLHKQKTNT